MIDVGLNKYKATWAIIITFLIISGSPILSSAKDTDIYQVSTKQNCYILLDNSGSMGFGVYEQSIDYGPMFDYLFTLNDSAGYNDYIYDTVNNSNYFFQNHQVRRKIYLWKGRIGLTITNVHGVNTSYTGDPADPDYLWFMNDLVDTHTIIDANGNLSGDGVGVQRLTVDGDGYILLDGVRLPLDRSIKHRSLVTLYDGSQIDNGFGGLLNAPGYYFSGYEGVTLGNLNVAENGDLDLYFFVTGNWVNMQAMYNLHYTTNNPQPAGAHNGDAAWKFEYFPILSGGWSEVVKGARYPAAGNYAKNLTEAATAQTIVHPGAQQIQVHFSAFDVQGNGNAGTWNKDLVSIYNASGILKARYDNDNKPTNGDGWSVTIDGDTVKVCLSSNNDNTVGTGYIIDKIRVTYAADKYLMQDRMDVAKDALLYVLDEFHGKMNWGYATYQYTGGGSGDGATLHSALNPNLTDDANRAAITTHVQNTAISNNGTPLGEALQDVFEQGYWTKRHSLDNLLCRKNYVISVTDGFPSDDTDWNRISDVNADPHLPFSDWDGDGWTADPYQYRPAAPPANYYDDVGHWMYTHSWVDKTEVANPANSYVNVMTHHVSFGMDNPLLKNAAEESGGLYIAAYNKAQLVSAFYSLALQMTDAVSFTSPVVSVDAANKIQNGDDLYLGLFLPQDSQSWIGNVKKYKLGDGSADRPNVWMIYDAQNKETINALGEFEDNAAAFWGDDSDANDHDNYGGADVKEDGAGEVLTEQLKADFTAGDYWKRPIYTWDTATQSLKKVKWDTVGSADLGVGDDLARDKVINYLYGYTFDANPANHAPIETRDWALGSIVHSRPVVIDYTGAPAKRYIAVGANDGMLHVFDDANGKEVFAFVPQDLMMKLKLVSQTPFVDMVDGEVTLYKRNKAPKYLIFGERKGGGTYWCLDISDTNPLNWHIAWSYSNAEIAQTWSAPLIGSILTGINSGTGERSYKDVLIFTGGYDPEEDNYPEPFNDVDHSGTPFLGNGNIDGDKWDKNNPNQDVNGNKIYDIYNTGMNEYGRGIYVVDIDNPANVVTDSSGSTVLPFSVSYGNVNVTMGPVQTLNSMKYCFPASPAIVLLTDSYIYKDNNQLFEKQKANVLKAIYAIDVYANVYKINYTADVTPDNPNTGPCSMSTSWKTELIFSGNPGSTSTGGKFGMGINATDQGRKAFYSPVVSWGGACGYFDAGNYRFDNVVFKGLDEIATLYFGTGDREHPTYTLVRDRFYSVYDDSSILATFLPNTNAAVSSAPYTENNLVNLTLNELDTGSALSAAQKNTIKDYLTDDAIYIGAGVQAFEYAALHEDDAKGWYIILEDQGSAVHHGEKVLSTAELYAEVLYFTSYRPSITDPCNPQGTGFAYSLNYCDTTAAYSHGRYYQADNIHGIPSDFAIITRDGQAGAMSMMGGDIVGGEKRDDFRIKGAGYGLELYYWRESDSRR